MKKNKLYLACGVLALLNIFLLNIFLKNFVYRIDLSQKKIYTLHPVSKEVLRSLKDYLNIEVYMSSKLPAEMNPHKQDLFDLLEEYRNYSRGLLKYAVYYPDKNKDIELKVRRIGIPEITFNVVEKDQVKVVNGNFGLAIFYRDKKEIIPVITETENLEYDLTSKILKLIEAENIKTVGLLFLGQKQENYSLVRRELEKIFNIRILSLIGKIPDDVSVLLVFGNKKLTPKELYNLDQFIIRGGKVIFFLQPVEIDYEKFIAKPLFEKDLEFLKNYGIYLKPNIVKDPTIPFIPIMTGQRIVYVPYHYFVKIMPKGVKHHFARDLTQLVLFWPSAIDTLENKDKKFKYTTIITSTDRAYRKDGNFSIHPFIQEPPPLPGETKRHLFALLVRAKFKSVFGSDTNLFKNWTDLTPSDTAGFLKEAKDENTIIFVGNSMFLEDNFVTMYRDNGLFFMNMVNTLTLGKDLTQIKAREIKERPIAPLNAFQKFLLQNGMTFGIPILVIVFGMIRFSIRRMKKRKYMEEKVETKEEKNDRKTS